MTPEDRRAIDGLFQRLDAVERQAREPRDPEAEALIARRVGQQPAAPYYMAQAVIVQQQALEAAEQKINELEQQARGRYAPRDRHEDDRGGPWNRGYGTAWGGGFLAGAMQTALGVTGGILLGSALGSLFGAGAAGAAEAPADAGAGSADAGDAGSDAGGDGGGFGGGGFDGGGMDFGGDF